MREIFRDVGVFSERDEDILFTNQLNKFRISANNDSLLIANLTINFRYGTNELVVFQDMAKSKQLANWGQNMPPCRKAVPYVVAEMRRSHFSHSHGLTIGIRRQMRPKETCIPGEIPKKEFHPGAQHIFRNKRPKE
ncbi:MAG: hypothetical protein WDN49_04005 [Acetobacteraceae bacterium]